MTEFLPAPIARKLLGVDNARLKELSEEGVIRAHASPGGRDTYYNRDDIGHLLGREIDAEDVKWAKERHQARLDSWKAYDDKRRIEAIVATPGGSRPKVKAADHGDISAKTWNQPAPFSALAAALADRKGA